MSEPSSDIPRESPRAILFQFVFFPLGVVLIGVAIFLLFGKLAGEEQSIRDHLGDIRNGSRHERWQAAYELSKSLKRGEAKAHPNLAVDVISVYNASKEDDPRVRQYLSIVMGKLGDRRATPVLLTAMRDQDVEARIYAVLALGMLKDPVAVPELITAADDPEKDVRKAAIGALGEMGDRRALSVLARAAGDPAADIRFNAAIALARMNDRRAIPPLKEMLDRSRLDRIAEMRPEQKETAMLAGIAAWSALVGKEGEPELRRLAASDPSMHVRAAAKGALEGR